MRRIARRLDRHVLAVEVRRQRAVGNEVVEHSVEERGILGVEAQFAVHPCWKARASSAARAARHALVEQTSAALVAAVPRPSAQRCAVAGRSGLRRCGSAASICLLPGRARLSDRPAEVERWPRRRLGLAFGARIRQAATDLLGIGQPASRSTARGADRGWLPHKRSATAQNARAWNVRSNPMVRKNRLKRLTNAQPRRAPPRSGSPAGSTGPTSSSCRAMAKRSVMPAMKSPMVRSCCDLVAAALPVGRAAAPDRRDRRRRGWRRRARLPRGPA